MNKNSDINNAIASYLRGELTEKEKIELNEWLDTNPSNQNLLNSLSDVWNTPLGYPGVLNMDEEKEKIWKRIQEDKNVSMLNRNKFSSRTIPTLKIAAVIGLLLCIGYLIGTQSNTGLENQEIAELNVVVKESPKGVKSRMQLPDGTRVWLNAASSISYQRGFSDSARHVSLKGEAYFEVMEDKKHPFVVSSGKVKTTALGTSFNIKAYNEEKIQVSLATGGVQVTRSDIGQHVVLLPGEQANAAPSGLSIVKFQKEIVLAWKNGTIFFDNTDFDEMIDVLEKWYDVSIVVKNLSPEKSKNLKATGKFKDQSLASVLKLISHSMKFTYTIDEKIVTIKF